MGKRFDPFDERLRDPVKRRKPQEVAAAKKAWQERILTAVEAVLHEEGSARGEEAGGRGRPLFVMSGALYIKAGPKFGTEWEVIRRNLPNIMPRLGYEKMLNSNAKDGRFKFDGEWTFLYRRLDAPLWVKDELRQYFTRK